MTILANKRALKDGKKTNDVLVTYNIWKALLAINNEYYTNNATFQLTIEGEKKSYRLHHLTNADLQLFITLFKVCNSNGNIRNVNRHVLYKTHCLYHEEPISAQQFYVSFEKLRLHKIFEVKEDHIKNETSISLHNFYNQDTQKPNRYVAVPLLVFTKEFHNLSLAAKIMFFDIYMQQSKKVPVLKRTAENLYFMLHKTQPHHLREVFTELTTTKMRNGKPLLSLATKDPENKKVYQFSIHKSLHKSLHNRSSSSDEKYREPIQAPLIYKRKATFIERVLTELGIGELIHELALLVNCMKKAGYRVIRHALYEIKKFKEENGQFPKDLALAIVKEIRMANANNVLDLANKRGCLKFIAPGLRGSERKDRYFEFTSSLSKYFSLREMDRVFKKIRPLLEQKYLIDFIPEQKDYRGCEELDFIHGIEAVRAAAWRKRIDVDEYEKLEEKAYQFSQMSQVTTDSQKVCNWLLLKIDELETEKKTPYIPADFKLETFILNSAMEH
ncbi:MULTISPECIES: hypothetical protein [Cytobacillus]|uniref:Initiator Rep protein domain-containing protein n=1 Tax=Cytobacillus oceanisediminis TaxID=665099 RepID=A0ABX3CN20_9BACI|nr:hypothetical protein [Cytobacillus oceanisediminis]EFV75048.1 hypothetical protein HMPREF1013_04693 [Bacillus sp. 2_A_57_CT2]MCM3402999.1 hypothetical protein [Cytobacillus oceanisediminis]OHX44595.1 hypothetical protein BBV17_25565 [Cytobacillus oceanisediminis]